MSRAHEQAVVGIRQVLAHVYADDDAPGERAEAVVDLLTTADGSGWDAVQSVLCDRAFSVALPAPALESLALRVMVHFIHATWSRPPSRLDVFAALRHLGVPERWLFVVCEVEPSHIPTGAA